MKTSAAIQQEATFTENIEGVLESRQMKLFNNVWMLVPEVGMPKWVDANGNYQYDRYLKAHSYIKNNRVSIDVGANLGLFSRRMAEHFQTVYCFEPVPLARACFSRNVSANNCILYPYGLGNAEYETEISYCESSIGGSTIGRKANENRKDDLVVVEEQIKLQVKTLDSFRLKNVDFIKIDIQGYELEMLQGARKTLIKNDPVILVELVADGIEHVEVPEYLRQLGYSLRIRIGKDGIFTKDSRGSRIARKIPYTKAWKKAKKLAAKSK